jgi:hypothetical protein
MAHAIVSVSVGELLRIWSELVEAYHGVNAYGGHVAQIYAYRLMPSYSTCDTERQGRTQAGAALFEICSFFMETYVCTLTVEKRLLLDWWAQCDSAGGFAHRVDIEIHAR